MAQIFLTENQATLGIDNGRFYIKHPDGSTESVPFESADSIAVFGGAQVTTQAITECLMRGVPVQYYSQSGSYFGRLTSTSHINVTRQKAQVHCTENAAFCLSFAQRVLGAKIRNQTTLLRRYARTQEKSIIPETNTMLAAVQAMKQADTVEKCMGHEGHAARIYFQTLGALVQPPDFRFTGRSRQPPLDAFNSMLSLGYTMLMNEVYGALEAKGLNPYFGLIHADKEKHPTLASDLMEEWRAVIVDSTVMSLVNGKEVSPEMFYTHPERAGIFLNRDGLKVFIRKIEGKFAQSMQYLSYAAFPVTLRRALFMQAGELCKAIEQGDPTLYSPVVIR
ncbi:MAG: CRISPR-associated endonuclease Cas1 [Oscillospiraceae bacterium]|jgi:CRISPR-associated protein Cas1|nr:CRISPR-associated endonuclease Cas1 [Oscillospiraceae bacterium]